MKAELVPSIKQQIAELKAAGWTPLTRTCWIAPAGSGCAGCFLGPHGAWKAMKRASRFFNEVERIAGRATGGVQ